MTSDAGKLFVTFQREQASSLLRMEGFQKRQEFQQVGGFVDVTPRGDAPDGI